jgi:hypothetical protein
MLIFINFAFLGIFAFHDLEIKKQRGPGVVVHIYNPSYKLEIRRIVV